MKKIFLLILFSIATQLKAQTDTSRILEIAKLLTISEFEDEVAVQNAQESIVIVDTFKNRLGNGCFGYLNYRWMLIKVISKHCEYILAYDRVDGGKFYKLKGFSSYNPKDIQEIIDDLNFESPPEESFVNELGHLKYCTSAFRMFIYRKRIPRSCASIREEEYGKEMRSYRGDISPR